MQRDKKDKILGVVTMGALCLMATSPAVAQTDRGGRGAAAPPGKLADRMPGTETQRMERGAYPTQSAQSGAAMSGDDATDLRGVPDAPARGRRERARAARVPGPARHGPSRAADPEGRRLRSRADQRRAGAEDGGGPGPVPAEAHHQGDGLARPGDEGEARRLDVAVRSGRV